MNNDYLNEDSNDYLWDKTGADPEIERLENLLQTFRCQETRAPALPAENAPFQREPARSNLRLAFAAAACLLFGAAAVAVRLQIAARAVENNQTLATAIEPANDAATIQTRNRLSDDSSNQETDASKIASSDAAHAKSQTAKPQTSNLKSRSRRKVAASASPQISKAAKPQIELSAAERAAYRKLMLALSITGEKLRIVKDKVDGSEE